MKPVLCFNPPTMAQQVYQYVQDHPRCNRTDIANDLGIAGCTVSSYLGRLCDAGKIKRYRFSGARKNGVLWEVGREEGLMIEKKGPDIGAPKQLRVSIWEPHMFRDPLVAMLFGKAA